MFRLSVFLRVFYHGERAVGGSIGLQRKGAGKCFRKVRTFFKSHPFLFERSWKVSFRGEGTCFF